MRNSKAKMVKRALCLIFAFLLSINSFAAVVSDNDGSAFITKAEFDSLKNNFQSQIDQYNTSIDAKIDSAIAAYFAGIRMITKEDIKTYVENYKELYWCHDFSIEAKEKKWTSRTASTVADEKTLQPDYTNQHGWAYWYKDRGARFQVIFPTNFGLAGMACRANFSSDGTYTKTSQNTVNPEVGDSSTILMMKVVGDSVIDSNPLIQYISTQYNMARFGLDWQSRETMYLTNGSESGRNITVDPIPSSSDDEYFTIKITGDRYSDWHSQVWTTNNTYAFAPKCADFGTAEPGRNKATLEATSLTFPQYSYFCSSTTRVEENQTRLYNMMLGTKSSYRLPYLYDYKLGGPNGQVTTGYEANAETTTYSFVDYSKWVKRPISTTFVCSKIFGTTQDSSGHNYTMNTVLSSTELTINIPVITRGYVRDLRSPVATYNGENLKICGGIPVLIEAMKNGKLIVKIKCNKKYDNATNGTVEDTDAKIKFKKTDCTDSLTNYLSGTYGDNISAKFDGSKTIDISNQTFTMEVQKGDNVWMNIDPITLGQHIRITDLQCTLEYE